MTHADIVASINTCANVRAVVERGSEVWEAMRLNELELRQRLSMTPEHLDATAVWREMHEERRRRST